jgi:hypothetical protein
MLSWTLCEGRLKIASKVPGTDAVLDPLQRWLEDCFYCPSQGVQDNICTWGLLGEALLGIV